jgi:hypothetical protein
MRDVANRDDIRDQGGEPADSEMGTQDLEKGMRPSRASAFATIAAIALTLLLVFNSGGLVRWTQQLPSGPVAAWVAERAADWDRLMRVPPPEMLEYVKKRLQIGEP